MTKNEVAGMLFLAGSLFATLSLLTIFVVYGLNIGRKYGQD